MATDLLFHSIQAVIARAPHRAAAMERILRVVEESGPRPRSVLIGLSGKEDREGTLLELMLCIGLLVPIGKTRAVVYGTPLQFRMSRKFKAA
jgi:hypothetical protein